MRELTSCPVCASECLDGHYIGITNRNPDDGKEWPVVKCGQCGHGFMNPQPEWQDLAGYYSASYEAYEADHGHYAIADVKTVEKARLAGEFRHLLLPIAGKTLLDVGCGGGYFLRIARQLGATVQGVEPSDAGHRQTQGQGIPVFHGMLDDYVAVTENQQKFDIITSNHVLEHAPDPVSTLGQMKSLLAPGGYIWISVPNVENYFARKLGKYWHSIDLPYHLQQFTPASLEQAGLKAGLKIRRAYTYSLPSAAAVSLRHHLRRHYFFPQRISEKWTWLNQDFASWYARRLDARGDGEAIIIEFMA